MVALMAAFAVSSSCSASEAPGLTDSAASGIEVQDGLAVSTLTSDLNGPTQMAFGADGQILVSQINGGEDDGTGTVISVNPASGAQTVLFERIEKPTGVAALDGLIWVMTPTALLSGAPGDDGLEPIIDNLPNNGRSQGTLTVDNETLLFNTSGRLAGDETFEGSGNLYRYTPGAESAEIVATGFKNAYAHTVDRDGQLWVTEIGDGRYDGERPPDELVAVSPGDDHGWPKCIGDQQPVIEHGGTPQFCDTTPPSQALFEPTSTPVDVVAAPWDDDLLLVALWVEGRVVAVDRTPRAAGSVAQTGTTVMQGFRPQSFLVDGDRLLVADYDGNRILVVTEEGLR